MEFSLGLIIGGIVTGIIFVTGIEYKIRTLPSEVVIESISMEYITTKNSMYYLPPNDNISVGDTIKLYNKN